MPRSRLPWAVALPLVAAGSFAAHWAAAAVPVAHAAGDAGEAGAPARSAGVSPLLLALGVTLVGALAGERLARRRGRAAGAGPALFLALPVAAFLLAEGLERALGGEGAPFRASLEPRLWAGLLLQLPFGVAAWAAARALLRAAARTVAQLLPQTAWTGAFAPAAPVPSGVDAPRVAPLARGHPQRGPPLPA